VHPPWSAPSGPFPKLDDAPSHGLKPVEEGRHRDLPLLTNRQPIRTVAGKKIWDMLRAPAWECLLGGSASIVARASVPGKQGMADRDARPTISPAGSGYTRGTEMTKRLVKGS
jgi:hypothetical protein